MPIGILLANGVSGITEVPPERWDVDKFYDPDTQKAGKTNCKWGGFLKDVDKFDPLFFNLSPAESEWTDPQQRLFLETCWHALETAGYTEEKLAHLICGVYAGVMNNDYLELISHTANKGLNAYALTGNSNSILASRIAYLLNLKGPTYTVDTACSSSLVAIDRACKSLQMGEADMMLAGGVTLYLTETPYIKMSKAGMLSATGQCHTFDEKADGFVPGEGVGVVLLKRLQDAVKDKDTIYGVITASSINQDGKTNGITAPSGASQKQLLRSIYDKPESILKR